MRTMTITGNRIQELTTTRKKYKVHKVHKRNTIDSIFKKKL